MKLLITAALTTLVATSALAGGSDVTIKDHYKTHTVKTPNQQYVCHDVQVPIYGKTGDASTFDTLGGAVIGGVIGNQFGGGSGKDALTILGAIAGADYANKNLKREGIVGYRTEERCKVHTTWETYTEQRYSHSSATFQDEFGVWHTTTFHRKVK